MKILVAGGAGYIGSCFVEYIFQNTNYDVIIIDDLSTGFKQAIHPKATFYKGSINNEKLFPNRTESWTNGWKYSLPGRWTGEWLVSMLWNMFYANDLFFKELKEVF